VELSLLLNELSHVPQSFKREQRWFCGAGIGLRCTRIVSQAGGDGSVIAIGHADDQVRIRPAPNAYELDPLTMQGMIWMGDRHPFLRWLGKGGSVL